MAVVLDHEDEAPWLVRRFDGLCHGVIGSSSGCIASSRRGQRLTVKKAGKAPLDEYV
jgi:hypothetical protein